MRFSVIIPTYNRNEPLHECLRSVLTQSRTPNEIILIDDDSLNEEFLFHERALIENAGCRFVYYKKDHEHELRGTSVSRNIGMRLASEDIVFILDDDLFLEPDFFNEVMIIWEQKMQKKRIGVGGVISNHRKKRLFEWMYNFLFVLETHNEWGVSEVGYQTWNDGIHVRVNGYYAHGGVCSYQKNFVKELGGFAVLDEGSMALEDVEFSLRAKQAGFFYTVTPFARTKHLHAPGGRASEWRSAFQESQNRKKIFLTLCKQDFFHQVWFAWSSVGWVCRQFLVGHIQKGLGMIAGLFT